MKKAFYIIVSLALWVLACTPEETEVVTASKVILSQEDASLVVGGSCSLTARLYPDGVTRPGVVWSSLDPGIASVSPEGSVTAVSPGVTYIVATSADGRAKSSCMVSVKLTDGYFVSILDEFGSVVDRLWRYPGAVLTIAAESSDDQEHNYSWKSSDPSAVSVDKGILSYKYQPSASADYISYAETTITVSSEDGTSASVPAVSNLLSEFSLAGMNMKIGSGTTLNPDSSNRLVLYYSDGKEKQEVPAGAYELSSSMPTVVSVEQDGEGYSLVSSGSGNSRLRITFPGCEPMVLADVNVAKSVPASFVYASSSTLVFTWTNGGSDAEDAVDPYNLALYRDQACTELVVSFDVPAGSACWAGKPLRFVFGGLEASTTYYFKVTNGNSGAVSAPVEARTEDFSVVDAVKVQNAGAGDVILAEDFSEIGWGADQFNVAAGWFPSTRDLTIPSGALSTTDGSFKVSDSTDGRLFGNARVTSDKRLYNWGFFGNSTVYSFAGYLRVGTSASGSRTHIVTPALSGIPDGKTATIEVSVTCAKYESNTNDVAVFLQDYSALKRVLEPDQKENSSFSGSGGKFTGATLSGGYALGADVKKWDTKTVSIEGVTNGDCLLIGSLNNVSGKNRFFLSDVKVQIISIN